MKRALILVGEGYGNIVMATPTITAVRSLGYTVDVLVESYLPDAATLLAGWDVLETIYLTRETVRRAAAGRGYDAVVRTRWNCGTPLGVGPEFSPDSLTHDRTHEAVLNLSAARALGYRGQVPPPHVERQLEILKSIDSRLEKMNGAVAKTLETVEENSDGIEKLKNTFLPHGQLDAEGFPRWWCQWPRAKDGIMNILDDVREMLKKKEV